MPGGWRLRADRAIATSAFCPGTPPPQPAFASYLRGPRARHSSSRLNPVFGGFYVQRRRRLQCRYLNIWLDSALDSGIYGRGSLSFP
jgi:hypothetical protein